ncbi:hypothetical protein RI129_007036 [Pyrocoelia pectoralis]|uniref:Uncharacterized protein n=1 Tax=Pyrocoelia pectoralis TaxID=417401 RepID=A0AAN7ZM50_9COLE
MLFVNVCVILGLFTPVYGYKILGLFPHKGKSHYDTYEPLMKALVAKGHHVTVMSHFPQKKPLKNLTDIDIRTGDYLVNVINLEDITGSRLQRYLMPPFLAYVGYGTCSEGLSHANFKNLTNSGHRFDVILTEFFNTECFLNDLNRYQAPIIGISSCTIMPWDDFTVGVPSNPAYIPNSFMPFSDTMTFLERFENTISYIFCLGVFEFLIDIPGRIVASGYFSNSLPNLKKMAANISLMLVNNHFSFTFPRPLPPNYIEVGGIHVGKLNEPPMVS